MGSLQEAIGYGLPCLLFPTDCERFGNAIIMEKAKLGIFVLDSIRNDPFRSPRKAWWEEQCGTRLSETNLLEKTMQLLKESQESEEGPQRHESFKADAVGEAAQAALDEA